MPTSTSTCSECVYCMMVADHPGEMQCMRFPPAMIGYQAWPVEGHPACGEFKKKQP